MSNFRNLALWIIIALLLVALFNLFQSPNQGNGREEVAYSVFSQRLDEGGVIDVTIRGNRIEGTFVGNDRFSTLAPEEPVNDVTLAPRLSQHRVQINIEDADGDMSPLLSILINWFPMLLLLAVWIFFIRQMRTGSGGAMGFGKSKAKMLTERSGRMTFDDVAGVDEAKDDLIEIVDFLRDPQKFQKLGGHIPKGVLLVGPPGTGKTLLSRAVAGEADVPFYSVSGSEFIQMFVGVGASRVRDLFKTAKENAPAIVFI
ncbi:MAG: ATP-dependent metallopeptidase FtsH/Yme1/Tma family protein, partial [Micropepsaceae bacterium]